MVEYEMGADQIMVAYTLQGDGRSVEPALVLGQIAVDSRRRAESGWRVVSTAAWPTRQGGQRNQILGSSGQAMTEVAFVVVFERR